MPDDPHESTARTSQFVKDPDVESTLEALNLAIRRVELPTRSDVQLFPAIFIVGVPRSGTTLLSQILCKYLEVGYINNLIARFWANPVLGIRLSRSVLPPSSRRNISLRSAFGTTQGIEGPHEFGYFWRERLALDVAEAHCLTDEERKRVDFSGLASLIRSMIAEFELPTIFKNPICGLQASEIARVHPDSLFICTERDDADVVKSILGARLARHGSESAWWSVKPSTFRSIVTLSTPVLQVESQVADCQRDFAREFSRLSRPPLMVSYEVLRRRPHDVVEEVVGWISSFGFGVKVTDHVQELTAPEIAGLY